MKTFDSNEGTKVEISLYKNTPGPVLASDFVLPHDVTIVNPNHVIANLNTSGELNMTAQVIQGHG